ncbi:TIGR04141 family sporadically distributed protein [Rossellomorea vietnamensis]|uniref:TIGR04141 family sporadically distributed protein n=1 Tax=Rossellomorea vietnamensis TaxID=218284 RepID=A0ACD4CDA0_9BACI|nr:DUF6119 family protein [Rossellomorea vietnamensis]UXH46442.1 TIGR04141 family sporadically distributed protein [Rossellomorea vietnamensis]
MSDSSKIKYTVYLIKEEYTEFEDVLDDEKYDQVVELREGLDLNGKVFIGHNDSSEPSWYSEVKEGLTDPPSLNNQSTRLVLLIKRSRRIFAFVFGHGKHMLKPESYERGFGFKVVLNNCEVSKLKSIDSSTIDTVTVQSRTQTSKSSNIYEFNIDDTRDLLKSVTAEARDFNRYGKVIAGRDPFHFYYDFSFATLKDLCDRVLEDSRSTRYKEHFEWIDYLSEIKDPLLINSLNAGLVNKINECYRNGVEDESIHLAPPEIINMEDHLVYSFLATGNKEDELSLASYIGNKKPKGDNDTL